MSSMLPNLLQLQVHRLLLMYVQVCIGKNIRHLKQKMVDQLYKQYQLPKQ